MRISALPSALADVLGGMALAYAMAPRGWFTVHAGKLPWLLLATIGVYLGGMACNDLLHARKDTLLGKKRPIVTGEISWRGAWFVMAALFVAAMIGGALAGVAGWVALLIVLIFLYNWLAIGRIEGNRVRQPLSRAAAGVAVIALCRALHVSLPLLAFGNLAWIVQQEAWRLFAASVFLYFCLVTVVSLFEDTGGGRAALRSVAWLLYAAVLVFPAFVLSQPGSAHSPVLGVFVPLLVLAWLLVGMQKLLDAARNEPTPPNLGKTVGAGIRGECLLMAGFALLLAPDQPWWGLAALACYPVGKLLSKWVSPT
ncbi:MAG: hypothetical protein KF696_15035 [Planctomycetes bacterium]|nr:hypothetical protein [Planctomycetota bacterium]MCW8135882.1 hypothetical protein [Planctomycetota bacterium]